MVPIHQQMVSYFLQETENSIAALVRPLEGMGQQWPAQLDRFLQLVWRGVLPKQGKRGRTSYLVHGRIGCRMIGPNAEVTDVDVMQGGAWIFDAWRVQQFARSIKLEPLPESVIQEECESLVQIGQLQRSENGWYMRKSATEEAYSQGPTAVTSER